MTSAIAKVQGARCGVRNPAFGVWNLAFCLLAATGIAPGRTQTNPWRPSRIYDYVSYQKNQWRLPITNYGTFGYGVSEGGGEWPAGSGDVYIYGAGIWIGSLKKTETGKDTLVTMGYNPNSGKSEMSPGAYDSAPGGYAGREYERVYLYPNDWPPDSADFPESLGGRIATPLRIPGSTDTNYFYYIPRAAVSSGDAWSVYNDRDPENHIAGLTPRPLGIEVYQSTYSWTLPWNKDIIFFKLDVRNRGTDTLRDMYLGMACDADVGRADNDLAGLCLHKYVYNAAGTDSAYADNLGYVWSEDNSPSGFVGFDFLQSPFVRNPDGSIDGINGLDDNGNGLIDEPSEGRQWGMTAFKIFTLANDPTNDAKQYLGMAGWDWWLTPPIYNQFDSTDAAPEDKRFLQATGPVTLAPNELTTVTIAIIGAMSDRSGPPPTWPFYLAKASEAAQQAYDNNWIMPEPPPNPNVTTIPGDGRVTLVWDDMPETAVDRFFPLAPTLSSPHYLEQDFQGYKVYRSRTAQPGDWTLLTQCDRADGVLFEDTTVVDSLRSKAVDAGLFYSYIDSSNLRLGFPYYYAVTAFDVNYLGDTLVGGDSMPRETLSLESGHSAVRAVPRTQPANFTPCATGVEQIAGNEELSNLVIEPVPLVPYAVFDETYTLRFLEPAYDAANRVPVYRYSVLNSAGDTAVRLQSFSVKVDSVSDTARTVPTVFDSVITFIKQETTIVTTPVGDSTRITTDTTWGWLPIEQMLVKLKMDSLPTQVFDRVVVAGSYPQDSVALRDDGADNKTLWAFRGSRYRIVWREKGGGSTAMTCDVYDLDNEVAVPYRYMRRLQDPDSADGWCFQFRLGNPQASETLVVGATSFFSICGSRFQFRPGSSAPAVLELPTVGDTWLVYSKALKPAPFYAAYEVSFAAMAFTDTMQTLNVKVVPNPYIVRNEWERHHDFRRLKFINLPGKCRIHIYNFAGDLVRTLEHDETKPNAGGLPNQYGGDEDWDLLNESTQKPAPGVYIFCVESDQGSQIGKFVLVY